MNYCRIQITKNFLILLSIILFLTCCNTVQPHKTIKENETNSKTLQVGDTLHINFNNLNDISISANETQNLWKVARKIISFANGDCSMCSYRLNKWQKFIKNNVENWNVPIIMIGTGESVESLKYLIHDQVSYDYPFLYDSSDHIKINNHIIDHPDFSTMLLDSVNQVLLIGNPIDDPYYFSKYQELIKNEN